MKIITLIGPMMKHTFPERYTMRPMKKVQCCSRGRKAKILTAGIHDKVFRGLKSEHDAEIGQNGAFFKGLTMVFSS